MPKIDPFIGLFLSIAALFFATSVPMFVMVRGDIADLRTEISGLRTELQGEMGALRTELRGEMGALRTELRDEIAAVRGEISGLRTELRDEISGLRADVDGEVGDVRSQLADVGERMARQEGMLAGVIAVVEPPAPPEDEGARADP